MSDFKVGDKVTCSAEYTYDGKTHLASFVRQNTYTIIQVGGNNLPDDRIVIGINGVVTAAVKADTLTLINTKATKTLREGELNKPLNSESTGKTPKDKAKDKPVSTTSALNAMFDASTTVDIQRKVVKINGEKYVVMVDTRGTADTSDDYYYPYGEAKFDFNYTAPNFATNVSSINNKKISIDKKKYNNPNDTEIFDLTAEINSSRNSYILKENNFFETTSANYQEVSGYWDKPSLLNEIGENTVNFSCYRSRLHLHRSIRSYNRRITTRIYVG